ncbi:MAG: hypothetical protein IT456_19900 [Planctomycetes bacterium]|nr:hypothetical protein [Planctomycetota bacterium]
MFLPIALPEHTFDLSLGNLRLTGGRPSQVLPEVLGQTRRTLAVTIEERDADRVDAFPQGLREGFPAFDNTRLKAGVPAGLPGLRLLHGIEHFFCYANAWIAVKGVAIALAGILKRQDRASWR